MQPCGYGDIQWIILLLPLFGLFKDDIKGTGDRSLLINRIEQVLS